MILKMIATQILTDHGMYEPMALKRAGEIEKAYLEEVSKMFVEVEPGTKRPFKLDTDSLPRESENEPADAPSTSAGFLNPTLGMKV